MSLLEATLDEAAIVFLADKLIRGNTACNHRKKICRQHAVNAKVRKLAKSHEQQLEQARKLQDMIQSTLPYHALVQAGRRTQLEQKNHLI